MTNQTPAKNACSPGQPSLARGARDNRSGSVKNQSWEPSASIETLRLRANIIQQIRDFFAARGVMEVETPLICHTSVTDPYIQSIPALFQSHPTENETRHYLQTSPEYAMKRLLAAGSGDIYQIAKAFRQGEVGRFHNPEFTMLEWYRLDFDHQQLMDEMDELLQLVLKTPPAQRKNYAELFATYTGINPHTASIEMLRDHARQHHLQIESEITDKDTWLQLMMSHLIEPQLGAEKPYFIYDFPTSQAALSRIQKTNPPVASRFEVYFKGIELANGFHELQDAEEQKKRFEKNLEERKKMGLTALKIDQYLLSALVHGLPNCAGVALGIDRLILLAANKTAIQECISFDFSRV